MSLAQAMNMRSKTVTRIRESNSRRSGALMVGAAALLVGWRAPEAQAFTLSNPIHQNLQSLARHHISSSFTPLHGSLPPYDAPYSQPEEEKNFWGNDYVPKERHPGTMPPGTRLEDKPIAELSPVSNIPYPHFQEWPYHYRFPAYQPRRLDFIEWMTQRGLMVEDDGDTRGVRFLGRKRRFRAQKAQADKAAAEGSDPMTVDERKQAMEGIDGDYWRSESAELVEPEPFIFERAKQKRFRIPYIVGVREEKAARLAAEAAAGGGGEGGLMGGRDVVSGASAPEAGEKLAKGRKTAAKPPPTAEI